MFLPMWQITLMAKFFTLLVSTLCLVTLWFFQQKEWSAFLNPSSLGLTVIWFTWQNQTSFSVPVLSPGFKKLFLLALWCFFHCHKDMLQEKERSPVVPGGGWKICETEILCSLHFVAKPKTESPVNRQTPGQAQPSLKEAGWDELPIGQHTMSDLW